MVHIVRPPGSTPPRAKPPPDAEGDSADEKQKRPPRETKPLPDRVEIYRMIAELQADLTGDDREAVQKAKRICRLLAATAAERLGLVVTGIQPTTVPQVVTASVATLKGADVLEKGDAGVAAETTE